MSIEKCAIAPKYMEEQRIKLGIEILPTLKKRLDQMSLDLNLKFWQVTQAAFMQYLDGERAKSSPDTIRARQSLSMAVDSTAELLEDLKKQVAALDPTGPNLEPAPNALRPRDLSKKIEAFEKRPKTRRKDADERAGTN
jgi:hypothetical protein